MIIPIVPMAAKMAMSQYDLAGDTMLMAVRTIIISMETTVKKAGVVSVPAADTRPVLPVTTPMVEMEGDNANVNIQFNEIAMNGNPVKRKP